jgi:hypothetical protein
MTRPRIFLTRMFLFLGIVVVVTGVLFDMLWNAFMANPALNGLILLVLFLGIGYIFRQVVGLYPEVRWIESFRRNQPGLTLTAPPRLLSPMATMLGESQGGKLTLSVVSMRTLLDGIASRLDESRDISRYLIGLLIFLGLLGTFWGLLDTINSVAGVVQGLSAGEGNIAEIFENLKTGLQAPLSGMGTAFSSSLFGLAGSLVLGFLDLQASQAQNRFFNDLEEWLSGLTRITGSSVIGEGQSLPAYVNALLEQTADNLETLQRTLTRSEDRRSAADDKMYDLTDKLATLTDQMRAEQTLMIKLVESQADIKPLLQRLGDIASASTAGVDEATRVHVRNMDVTMSRLLEETITGRAHMIEELRSEIKLLARTVAALGDMQREESRDRRSP